MSIRKLLGTAACMAIIGVSAGISYGQFQRLTAQVAPSDPMPLAAAQADTVPLVQPQRAEFVSGSVTTWTSAEASEVTQPTLIKPVFQAQPEPPIAQFETGAEIARAPAPILEPLDTAEAEAPVIEGETPALLTATFTPVPTEPETLTYGSALASKPALAAIPSPRDMRRLRSVASTSGETDVSVDEKPVPPRKLAAKPKRPALNASTRAAQRVARFERIWVTGVYR